MTSPFSTYFNLLANVTKASFIQFNSVVPKLHSGQAILIVVMGVHAGPSW